MSSASYEEVCAAHRWEVPRALQHRRRRLRQASARQAGDGLGELRRLDPRARPGASCRISPTRRRTRSPRAASGAATASPSCCRRRPRRPRSSSASGSSARSCSRCRSSTATTRSSTASADSEAKLLVTDAANAPRFDHVPSPERARARATHARAALDRPRSAPTRRPTIPPSSTTRPARPGWRRGSSTRTATSSGTRSSSTATRSRTASASTAWASGPGRPGSRRCSGRGGSARCSASTGARPASTRTSSSTSSAATR